MVSEKVAPKRPEKWPHNPTEKWPESIELPPRGPARPFERDMSSTGLAHILKCHALPKGHPTAPFPPKHIIYSYAVSCCMMKQGAQWMNE